MDGSNVGASFLSAPPFALAKRRARRALSEKPE